MSSEAPSSPTTAVAGRFGVAEALGACGFVLGRAWAWGRRRFAWLLVLDLLTAVLPAVQVLAVALLVSVVESGGQVVLALVALTLLIALAQLAGELQATTKQREATHLHRHYLNALAQRVAATTPQELARVETTARIAACRASASDLAVMAGVVTAAAGTIVTAATLCASVWRFSPLAGLLVAAALVPVLVAYARVAHRQDAYFVPYGKRTRRATYLMEQLVAERSASELSTLGSARKVAAAADRNLDHATRLLDRILVALGRGSAAASLVTAALLGAALVAIVQAGGGSAGLAGGVFGVIAGLSATRAGGFAFGQLIAAAPKVAAFRALLESLPQVGPQSIRQQVDTVQLIGVQVSYPGAGHPALNGVTMAASKGTIIALVGVNGAGKTSAVNALLGIVDITSGSVQIDGVDASTLSLEDRLGCYGLLTQEFGRYEISVRDNVALGSPDPVHDDQIWAALESAGAADLVRNLPDGLDSQLGTQFGGVGLSGGQWQRLALARIYLRAAPVWVLDEPTSAIDAEAEQQIFAELQQHKAGRITIVVSHRAWTLKGMDHIYVFDHGRIVQQGRYQDLVNSPGRFSEIFAEQA